VAKKHGAKDGMNHRGDYHRWHGLRIANGAHARPKSTEAEQELHSYDVVEEEPDAGNFPGV